MKPITMTFRSLLWLLLICVGSEARAQYRETIPAPADGQVAQNFDTMWAGIDVRGEPLDSEVLHQWEEDNVIMRVVRFRVGVFKGERAMVAAIYGFPKEAQEKATRVPGLVQIHGGGQYADYRACLMNGQRGYATLSLAWAGRINAPDYRVSPREVSLFWEKKTNDPDYKVTTDWGAVDGYHAPSRNQGNQFPSAAAKPWTLDQVESPHNSSWFLCALAARRALTYMEQQAEVDPDRLGVYGHSMGGKLTVMTAVDPRVKAAAPSCGGISDRDNSSLLFRRTLGDDVSLRRIQCPIVFLSPANDFHGRIGDLPDAISEIGSKEWRVTCSPHHNHQDTPEYEVATLLWFDQHLKKRFKFPRTPETELVLKTDDRVPQLVVRPDRSKPVKAVHVYYTQEGKPDERPEDMQNTLHRYWHPASPSHEGDTWTARLTELEADKPLWAYANVEYPLSESVSGAGYYYGSYTAAGFNVSSLLDTASASELAAAEVNTTEEASLLIEDFAAGWENAWFTYRPHEWARTTNKLYDPKWHAPDNAVLVCRVRSASANTLVIRLDDYAATAKLDGRSTWQEVRLAPHDFQRQDGESLVSWGGIRQLRLSPREQLRPRRGQAGSARTFGGDWQGNAPEFRDLRWQLTP